LLLLLLLLTIRGRVSRRGVLGPLARLRRRLIHNRDDRATAESLSAGDICSKLRTRASGAGFCVAQGAGRQTCRSVPGALILWRTGARGEQGGLG
jgi:hypothetical protein